MTKKIFPLSPGDLVRFNAYKHDYGASEIKITKNNSTTIIKSGTTRMIPPVMVITEVVNHEKSFNELDGKLQHSKYKAFCQWFSYERSEFQERWFDVDFLTKLEMSDTITCENTKEQFAYSSCVTLKTALFSNRQIQEEVKTTISVKEEQENEILGSIVRTFDTLNYLPPKMLITEVTDRNPKPVIFDKKTGDIRREISQWIVKCMWYDYKTGKYSEHYFAPESLVLCEHLADLEFSSWDILTKDRQVL